LPDVDDEKDRFLPPPPAQPAAFRPAVLLRLLRLPLDTGDTLLLLPHPQCLVQMSPAEGHAPVCTAWDIPTCTQ
jgi:hypothetical protein